MSQTQSSTFRQLLTQNTDTVERPRALAAGHYIGLIKGFEFGVSSKKQTPYLRVLLTPTEETDDVLVDANEGMDLSRRELRADYYITPASLYRLSDMLDAVLGKTAGRSFDERIPELRGAQVMFNVTVRESEDGAPLFNDVGTIVAN
jgi:hypothetical protein